MAEIYVGWFRGMFDPKVLRILQDGGIAGIEMSNLDDSVEKVLDAGLKYNAHVPGGDLTTNLANPNFIGAFDGERGERVKKCINMSPVPGFHLGYSCKDVHKLYAAPNQPKGRVLGREETLKRISRAIIDLEETISQNQYSPSIAVETLDFSREVQIPWEVQKPDILAARPEIEKTIKKYKTVNTCTRYVTEPKFVKEVFDEIKYWWSLAHDKQYTEEVMRPCNIGFIADIGHMFISGDAYAQIAPHPETDKGDFVDNYVQGMMNAVGKRTYEMHLTLPEQLPAGGYSDQHWWFKEDDPLSQEILRLAGVVKDNSPNLKLVTLEMREHGKQPEEFANSLVEQRNLVKRKLNL